MVPLEAAVTTPVVALTTAPLNANVVPEAGAARVPLIVPPFVLDSFQPQVCE